MINRPLFTLAALLLVPLAGVASTLDSVAEEIGRLVIVNSSRANVQAGPAADQWAIRLKPAAVNLTELKPNHYYRTLDGKALRQHWAGLFENKGVPAVLVWQDQQGVEHGASLNVTAPVHNPRTGELRFQAGTTAQSRGSLSSFSHYDGQRLATGRLKKATLYLDDVSGRVIRPTAGAEPSATGCVIEPYTQCPGVDLSGEYLAGADLYHASLTKANLSNANLTGTILMGADLSQSTMTTAILLGAVLTNANLSAANLSSANLIDAYLYGALLKQATLTQADLSVAKLMKATLIDADLTGATLIDANMKGADLTGAIISNTVFCDTTMPNGSVNNSGCKK